VNKCLFIHSEDREILRHLYAAHVPVDVYYFHERYQLSPGQIARVIRKYSSEDKIVIVDDSIELTEKGRRWVLRNRRQIFMSGSARPWKQIPDEFRNTKNRAGNKFKLSVQNVCAILNKRVTG